MSSILDVEKEKIFLFENGRTGQYVFLNSLGLNEGDSVAVQGFTCNAVINPILWLNLKPLYIDIDPMTLNISFDSFFERIDEGTKVVVLQHTFGNPVFKTKKDFNEFIKKMHEKNMVVFEDCAHSLGGEIEGQKLGTFGDAALFSFGMEKVLSTRVGGALVVNNDEYLKKAQGLFEDMRVVGCKDTFFWLLNPFFWRILRNFKNQMKIAKFLKKIGFLNMGFEDSELSGIKPKYYPRKISNALGCVVLSEIEGWGSNLSHRRGISEVYGEFFSVEHLGGGGIPFVRFPIVCETKGGKMALKKFLEGKSINVGNWYEPVIYPESTELGAMMYEKGSCKIAEIVSSRILNLPTGKNITKEKAREISENIISFLDDYETKGDS